jgi:saccharopine dehydrogenase-like NADP-dependent oxidoreductase
MVARLLESQLQYQEREKDLCVMLNRVGGIREGARQTMTCTLLIERDLTTGLMAMSLGVAYPACIAAEMIAGGEINARGVLSPAVDLPCDLFMDRLRRRGITVNTIIESSK